MADVKYVQATRVYAKDAPPAVDALDLDIKDGEFMVLVGPSGSGKTTALRMLAGLESVDSGAVFIDGVDVTEHQPGERVAGGLVERAVAELPTTAVITPAQRRYHGPFEFAHVLIATRHIVCECSEQHAIPRRVNFSRLGRRRRK